jgi:predicted metalloprotease with PDZ domain
MPIITPWPALVRNGRVAKTQTLAQNTMQAANLANGQGYKSQSNRRPTRANDKSPNAAPVPENLLYHPRDLADLNNSLLICGDLVTASTQARDCVIQLATDRLWQFDTHDALELVRQIARTEMGFFGDSPTPQITVLLAANRINTQGGFDTYGVHTGSSVLIMMNPATTLGDLEAHVSSVIAHEMFHGWLGEAIPQQDLEMLWFTEGATTWYAARMLQTAGIWSHEHAQSVLQSRLERDYTGSPHFGEMAVATAAKGIMASPEQVRFGYAGGMNAVMALDRYLAQTSGKRRPLDGVLRTLYKARNGDPLTREQFVQTVRNQTGIDIDPWLDEHVYSKSTLPAVDSVL